MKTCFKHFICIAATTFAFAITSCKKAETFRKEETQSTQSLGDEQNGLPGANSGVPISAPDANGLYYSTWNGGIIFSHIYYDLAYFEGKPVNDVSVIINPNSGFAGEIISNGPTIIMYAWELSNHGNFTTALSNYNQAYSRYRDSLDTYRRDTAMGITDPQPKKPAQPKVRNFIASSYSAGGWTYNVFKGIVVRSNSSPSTFVIMPDTFDPIEDAVE